MSQVAGLQRQLDATRAALRRETKRARTDVMTGLPNRLAFEEACQKLLERGVAFGFVWLDVTNLKGANEHLGHVEADEMLRRIAASVRVESGRGDRVFRWGGDEFIVLLPGGTDLRAAVACRDRLEACHEAVELAPGVRCYLVGQAGWWCEGADLRRVLNQADLALEERKEARKRQAGEVVGRDAVRQRLGGRHGGNGDT